MWCTQRNEAVNCRIKGEVPKFSLSLCEQTFVVVKAQVLLITPKEVEYFRHGGILQYVLRQLASRKAA